MKKKFIFRGIYWIRWCHTGHCYWKTEYSKRFWIVNAHVNVNLIQIIYRASYFALGKMKIGRNFFSSTLWLTFYNFLRHKRDFFCWIRKSYLEWRKKLPIWKLFNCTVNFSRFFFLEWIPRDFFKNSIMNALD